jgi:uncharacterized membrane protein YqaE (UPF0057 family)
MKNLSVKLTVFAIVAVGMVLSSCNSTIEVTKRQHRKGYYVSVSKKNSDISLEKYQEEDVVLEATKNRVVNDALVDAITTKSTGTDIEGQLTKKLKTDESKHLVSSKIEKTSLLKTVKAVRKAKKEFKQLKKSTVSTSELSGDEWEIDNDIVLLLMIIVAWIAAPAVVFLIKGESRTFYFNLILWCLGFAGVGIALGASGIIFGGFLAFLHALYVIFRH